MRERVDDNFCSFWGWHSSYICNDIQQGNFLVFFHVVMTARHDFPFCGLSLIMGSSSNNVMSSDFDIFLEAFETSFS